MNIYTYIYSITRAPRSIEKAFFFLNLILCFIEVVAALEVRGLTDRDEKMVRCFFTRGELSYYYYFFLFFSFLPLIYN